MVVRMTKTQRYLNAREACERLNIGPVTLWNWEKKGRIRVERPEGIAERRISMDEIQRINALPRNGVGIIWGSE